MDVEANNDLNRDAAGKKRRQGAEHEDGTERPRWWTRGCIGGSASRPLAPAAGVRPPPAVDTAAPGVTSGRQEQPSGQDGGSVAKERPAGATLGQVFNARFVTWNLQRRARGKASVIERLIRDLDFPPFIALQETADVETSVSEIKAIGSLGYNILGKRRDRGGSKTAAQHGGVLLLVDKRLTANEYQWREADAWNAGCETVSVIVTPPNDAPPFIVSSVYISGRDTDAEGFGRLLRSAKDNQVILGDLNAQLPGLIAGVQVGTAYRKRGEVLDEFLADRGWLAPTPTGVTRPATAVTADGRTERLATGTNYDHILVGCDVVAQIPNSEAEAYVVDGTWPSDHNPVTWGAEMSIRASDPRDLSWRRGIAWHDVSPHHEAQFNIRFQGIVAMSRAREPRRMEMSVIESALTEAARCTLPRVRAPPGRGGGKPPPLFDTPGARQHIEAAAAKYGNGDAGRISKAATEARRRVLAEHSAVEPNPSSVWNFIRRWFGFNDSSSMRPPLETENPKRRAKTGAERVATLGQLYAQVHSDPATSAIKAQDELAAVVADIERDHPLRVHQRSQSPAPAAPQPVSADAVSVTELRACLAEFQAGKASDFLGIKAEHLKLLNDASLAVTLPFFDRCITRAAVPAHWRTAVVTPVPKAKRDLSIRRNWRPVSVTALLCRACESIIHNRVQHRIEQNGGALRPGKSQFGFRRGVGTSLALAGLSMFIRDGQRQRFGGKRWNEQRPPERSVNGESDGKEHHHDTLLVCVDASDAFCRALPAKAVRRLLQMGLVTEARWIAQLLSNRSFKVREGGVFSDPFLIARGVPQGSIIGPLLWSLVIEDLIERCEAECRIISPGCVAIPIIFADDINFVIRGFNPSSMIAKANKLMRIVNKWSTENDIPMSKLQANWISANGARDPTFTNWLARDGEIVLNKTVRCTPGVQPVKILGVTYDSDFKFGTHVDNVIEECTKYKGLMWSMSKSIKAEKLAVIYKGLILSRLTYAAEAWYPFIEPRDAERLHRLHRDCCFAITGCRAGSHGDSVCYEAGFYTLNVEMCDELIKLADKLRRSPRMMRNSDHVSVFGPAWVAALFRDERMPTAAPRLSVRARIPPAVLWPERNFHRGAVHDARSASSVSLRDIGVLLDHGDLVRRDRRAFHESLRPMPRAFPYAPQELRIFDSHVQFVTKSPAGLVKPENFETLSEEVKLPFRIANEARINDLVRANGARTLYLFTDGARVETMGSKREKCAGAFAICSTATPQTAADVLYKGRLPANPIACIYTAELLTINAALVHVRDHPATFAEYDRIVLITDSKSALESMQTTWLRRIGDLEQRTCRVLFDLATAARPFHVTLAFVFSHTGGCPGNELADKLAEAAMRQVGEKWRGNEIWNTDSTRRVQRDFHDEEHTKIRETRTFRARNVPGNGRANVAPSARLPVGLSRAEEILLFRARVGTMPDVGGFLPNRPDPCPLCGVEGALGRDGKAIEHLLRCVPPHTMPASTLWSDPLKAVQHLRAIRSAAMATGQCFISRQPHGRTAVCDRDQHQHHQRPALQQPAASANGSLHFLGETQ